MIGHLVIYFSGWLGADRPLVHSQDFQQALPEIWPAQPRHTWPRPAPLDYRRLDAMFDMHGRYVDRAA